MALIQKYILKDLSYLVESTRILEKGDYTQPIKAKGGSEIKELAKALELMRQSILKGRQELEASREKFKILSDSASDWIIWRSPRDHIIYISPSCKQITGYTADQFMEDPQLYHKIIHPDYREKWLEHVHMADTEGRPLPMEFQITTKNGHKKWISHVCSPLYDTEGNFIGTRASNVDITGYRLLMEKLEKNNKKLRALSNKILYVQEMERKHLSRELHDELGQIFTAIKLSLQMLDEDIVEIDSKLKGRLGESISLINLAMKQIRRQALSLRPPALDNVEIMEIARDKCNCFAGDTGIETRLEVKGDIENISRELGLVIYRCLQESLTNIVRHAEASRVDIIFNWQKNRLLLTIEDNGCGFDLEEKSKLTGHIGLIGMKERIDLIDGHMKIDSSPNKGTKIQFTIPLGREEEGKNEGDFS